MTLEELATETTEDLIEYISWGNQQEYKDLAERAFIAFCLRFRDRVQRTCRIICEKSGFDHTVADELAKTVFERFYKFQKYNPKKCPHKDRDKCIELYLYRIAQRALINYLDGLKKPFHDVKILTELPEFDDYFEEDEEISVERRAILQKRYETIKLALGRLSQNHKTIYLTYLPFENKLKKGEHYLPREFLKKLQDHLGISQASIRVYKKQAYDKVNEYLAIYGGK